MKIFALDTATSRTTAALVDGEAVLMEITLAGLRRGERVAEVMRFMLESAGLTAAELDAYVIGLGPGSFTGLRIGLGFIKGLSLVHPRPTAGVSTLQSLAAAVPGFAGIVLPLIDARKGEVFTARFRADGQGTVQRESEDQTHKPEKIADLILAMDEPVLLLGDGLARWQKVIEEKVGEKAVMAPAEFWGPRASVLAALALPRLREGKSDPVSALVPIYVRYSDTELSLGPVPPSGDTRR